MRILFTAAPFHGHVNTVLPLVHAARAAGHDAVLATGADLANEAARRRLDVWPVGPTNVESGMPMSLAEFWDTAEERAADLVPLVEQWRPDLVVSEELELAGPIMAARTHTRLLVHGLGLAAAGPAEAFAPDLVKLGRRWGAPDLAEIYLGATYLSVSPPSLQPAGWSRRRLVLVRPGLGEPTPGEALPPELDRLPYERTVHLTLGTVFHQRRPEVMRAAIAGLRELAVNLVVTVGPRVAPEVHGPQPSHVVVAQQLPHSLLLPRCDAVVSQGGAGILLGALAHGLPQLVLPQGADQFANGAAVHAAGAGLLLDGDDVSPAAISVTAQRLLSDQNLRVAAEAVRAEIARMPTAADVVGGPEWTSARGAVVDR
jgi:UDP:flavonoid glycosyltransferase YjiC (YdhE family)